MFKKLNLIKKQLRREWYKRAVLKKVGSVKGFLWCNKKVKVTRDTHLGDNVCFNGANFGGDGKITIGDNFHSAQNLTIVTSWHDYEGSSLPFDSGWISKDVVIGKNVWIGEDVLILGGATIGDGAVIQARSVVASNIPPLAIAGGHPAKTFAYRDEDHYRQLDDEKRWHTYSWNKYMT